VRLTVVIDCADPAALAPFWAAALEYQQADAPEGYAAVVPATRGDGPVVLLQRVPEDKAGKNRVHLDLHPDDPHAHLARLEGLGARRVGSWVEDLVQVAGVRWVVMNDPEGNEFCLVEHVA
jgi:predicted enzyme related to lactoylglutathione lyase